MSDVVVVAGEAVLLPIDDHAGPCDPCLPCHEEEETLVLDGAQPAPADGAKDGAADGAEDGAEYWDDEWNAPWNEEEGEEEEATEEEVAPPSVAEDPETTDDDVIFVSETLVPPAAPPSSSLAEDPETTGPIDATGGGVSVGPIDATGVSHYVSWTNVAVRVQACQIRGHRVRFVLARPVDQMRRPACPDPWQAHIEVVLAQALADGERRLGTGGAYFKGGITYWPSERLDMDDYSAPDRVMYVALISERSDDIAGAEIAFLERHRRYGYDPSSGAVVVVNQAGHPKCRNRKRGGGGAYHGNSPHFFYVIVGNIHGWHPNNAVPDDPDEFRIRPPPPPTPPPSWEILLAQGMQRARARAALRSRSPPFAPEPC